MRRLPTCRAPHSSGVALAGLPPSATYWRPSHGSIHHVVSHFVCIARHVRSPGWAPSLFAFSLPFSLAFSLSPSALPSSVCRLSQSLSTRLSTVSCREAIVWLESTCSSEHIHCQYHVCMELRYVMCPLACCSPASQCTATPATDTAGKRNVMAARERAHLWVQKLVSWQGRAGLDHMTLTGRRGSRSGWPGPGAQAVGPPVYHNGPPATGLCTALRLYLLPKRLPSLVPGTMACDARH